MLLGEPDEFSALDDEKILPQCGGFGSGRCGLGKFIFGGTDRTKGALGATWDFGKANEGAEFHESLIMEAWIFARNDAGGEGLELFLGGGAVVAGEESAQDAGDVAIESGGGDPESDTGDGTGGVVTDTWKEDELFRIRRKLAFGKAENSFGQGVKEVSSAIVTEAFPDLENGATWGASEGGPGGKATKPAVVVGKNGRDTCLLGHELGDGDAVGGGMETPRKGSLVATVPRVEAGEGVKDF